MGGNSDHQCIVDPAGGVQPKYIGESEGISFLLDQPDPDMFALCKRPVQTDSLQTVITQNPKYNGCQEDQQQINEFSLRNTENIPYQQAGIFAEIAATGQNCQTDSDTTGRKD